MLTRDGCDRVARVLIAALTHGQEFVFLVRDEKEAVLAALTRRTTELAELVELRQALFDELTWQRQGLTPRPSLGGIEGATARRSRKHVNVAWV